VNDCKERRKGVVVRNCDDMYKASALSLRERAPALHIHHHYKYTFFPIHSHYL